MGRSIGNIVIKNDPVKSPDTFILNLPHITSRGVSDAKYDNYRPTSRAEGGYWLASFRIYGRENVIKEMFENGLGRYMEVWGHGIEADFEGRITDVILNIPPDSFSKTLRTVSNKGVMRADYDDDGVVERSTTIQSASSQKIYGVADGIISGGQLDSLGVADQAVQAFVDLKAFPMPAAKLGGASEQAYLDVKVQGYISTLQNRVYNQTTDTGTQSLNSQVADIIGTHIETYTLKNNLKQYYTLDEASDGTGAVTRSDKGPNSQHLTDTNTTASGAAKLYNGADFELGNTEYLTRASEASLQPTGNDLTVAFWYKPESVGTAQHLVGKWGASPQYQYVVYMDSAGPNLEFHVSNNGSADVQVADSTTIVNDTWYFVVCWHDATNDLISIQVDNGTPTTAAHTTGIFTTGTANFTIGGYHTTGNTDGIIDEVGIWDRVLTTNERSALYNSGSGWGYHQYGDLWLSEGVGEFIRQVETQANTTTVTKEYDVDRRAFDIVMDLPKLGDTGYNRWILYCTGRDATGVLGRKAVLKQASPVKPPTT